ncbi:hypothetical protein L1887_00905 [Cichorium endivia]|nr:hypothetical protein L1887_00905 [Cichorium endivia]
MMFQSLLLIFEYTLSVVIIGRAIRKYYDRSTKTEEPEEEKAEEGEALIPPTVSTWTSSGKHRICCLPCGHLYGLSCIKKWLKRLHASSGKCEDLCTLKDIGVLYAAGLYVADEKKHKRVRSRDKDKIL